MDNLYVLTGEELESDGYPDSYDDFLFIIDDLPPKEVTGIYLLSDRLHES